MAPRAPAWGLWGPGLMLRVLSRRTATVWKTLCPFWGEEYQVHLPPTFHAVAFYVMDEDALRSVAPMLLGGLHPPSAPLWPISLLGLLVTLRPLYSLEGGGVQEGLEGCRCECVGMSVCVDSLCLHRVCVCGNAGPGVLCEHGRCTRKWACGEHELGMYMGPRVSTCAATRHMSKGHGSCPERPLEVT